MMECLHSSSVSDVLCTALHPHALTPSPVHRHSISHPTFCPGGAVEAGERGGREVGDKEADTDVEVEDPEKEKEESERSCGTCLLWELR